MSRLGDLIRTERVRQKMTPKQVAKKSGVSESYIMAVEAGTRIIADDQARRILKAIGLKNLTHNWLNDKSTALACVILIGFPFISGMYFLIFHTALNALDYDMIEAAVIDGATPRQIIFSVQLPNLRPEIKTVFTLSLISSLSGFGNIFATTGGGPGYVTMIPSMQIYNVAFGDGDFGYASSLGVLLMIVVVIITLVSRRFLKEDD